MRVVIVIIMLVVVTRVDADGATNRVISFCSQRQWLDIFVELKGFIQFEEGDVVCEDCRIKPFVLPHLSNTSLLDGVLVAWPGDLDVVCAGHHLKPSLCSALDTMCSADDVQAINNCGSASVSVVWPNIKVL